MHLYSQPMTRNLKPDFTTLMGTIVMSACLGALLFEIFSVQKIFKYLLLVFFLASGCAVLLTWIYLHNCMQSFRGVCSIRPVLGSLLYLFCKYCYIVTSSRNVIGTASYVLLWRHLAVRSLFSFFF